MYKDVICENNNIRKMGWNCIRAIFLYTKEAKLVLLQTNWYKFKMFIYSLISVGSLSVSRNLSVSSKLSNL